MNCRIPITVEQLRALTGRKFRDLTGFRELYVYPNGQVQDIPSKGNMRHHAGYQCTLTERQYAIVVAFNRPNKQEVIE